MRAVALTAGERIEVTSAHRWIGEVLAEGLAGESLAAGPGHGQPGHGQPDREATIGVTVDGTDGP
ncbi:MAG: hypothetical protein M0030_22880, partial [Actinomycetota bacterium]|nr:hypothetical protein [Actinomycetota bacterium]